MKKYLFWLHYHVTSINLIASFAFNFSQKEFIRFNEEINTPIKINFLILIAHVINVSAIISSQMAPSTKTSKIQVIKGYQVTKRISIKTSRNFFILMTSSGNKYQLDYRFIDGFYTKTLKVFVRSSFSNKQKK